MKDLKNLPEVNIQGSDGKWHTCTPLVATVKGGKAVIYATADGTEVKREPLARYLARVEREEAKEAK